ncbi:hypothetical protein ACO0K7_02215 [Undibacterium sp. Ji67W]|uniref:hypothetical protein n=1 Tax=Undibacterium sp. Ji67W TaxID=3413042 RepID=UPI003BF0EDB8
MKKFVAFLFGISALCAYAQVPSPHFLQVSNASLLELALTPIDLSGRPFPVTLSIGTHSFEYSMVVAELFCSNDCPSKTKRVIHYEFWAGDEKSCRSIEGEIKAVSIPKYNGIEMQKYCFPKIIIDNWDNYEKCSEMGNIEQCKELKAFATQ